MQGKNSIRHRKFNLEMDCAKKDNYINLTKVKKHSNRKGKWNIILWQLVLEFLLYGILIDEINSSSIAQKRYVRI